MKPATRPPRRFALTIAGSDSSGGAGIQADLRVFGMTGIVGASAISAITAQGPDGVVAIELVSPELLEAQIDEAFRTYEFGAVKIGMLGGAEQVRVVAAALIKHQPNNTVLDPVLSSTGGVELLDRDGIEVMKRRLIPLVDVLTPNRQELAVLSGMSTKTDEECIAAAAALDTKVGCTVVVTGGDQMPKARDLVIGLKDEPMVIEREHVETLHNHGTGCAFSSAIAGALACGTSLDMSIRAAKALLHNALNVPVIPTAGPGHPGTYNLTFVQSNLEHFAASKPKLEGIYVITDHALNPGLSHLDLVRAAIRGGVSVVQLRDKNLSTPDLIEIGMQIRELTLGKATFIVNDRVDVALACGADGVHLGPEDMKPADARRQLGWSKLIGCSVSDWREAEAAADFASYLAVGAIFGSSTKHDAGEAVGLERLADIKSRHVAMPVVAIGGINHSNIASVAAAGADAAAVVSAIVGADDPERATSELMAEFERGKATR